jgi:hypothetical protein
VSGCNVDADDVKSIFRGERPTLKVNFNPLYTPLVRTSS